MQTKLSEVSHSSHTVWFHLYKMSRIGKSIETESRLVVAAGGVGGRGSNGEWVLDDKDVLKLTVVTAAQRCECIKNYQTAHFGL